MSGSNLSSLSHIPGTVASPGTIPASSEWPLVIFHSQNVVANQFIVRSGAYGWTSYLTLDDTNVLTFDGSSLAVQNLSRTVFVLRSAESGCSDDWPWTHQAGWPSADFSVDALTEGLACGLRIAPLFVAAAVEASPAETLRAMTSLPIDRLAVLIGVSRSTYHNWLAGKAISPDRSSRLQAVIRLLKRLDGRLGEEWLLRDWLLQNKVGQAVCEAIKEGRMDLAEVLALRVVRAHPLPPPDVAVLTAAAGAPFVARGLSPRRSGGRRKSGEADVERQILGHAADFDEGPGEEDLGSWIAASLPGAWPQAG